MSSKQKSANKNGAKPEVLKSWKIKLLVLTLCAISFFAGWQSHFHHSNNQCLAAGGRVTVLDDMTICELR